MGEIENALTRAMPAIARRLMTELVLACPVDTGRLRNSIKVKVTDRGLLIWMVDYGLFVEHGTNPHTIRPKEGGTLHWHKTKGRTQHAHPHSSKMGSDAFFGKEVKHPGTRPNPFIRTTILNKLRQIISEELSIN